MYDKTFVEMLEKAVAEKALVKCRWFFCNEHNDYNEEIPVTEEMLKDKINTLLKKIVSNLVKGA